ncbi:MAG: ABC transporter permease [Spirochaetaceae bacterium]|jgi:NitT/TauT family transport system permease protein|nr:ABC transporter permease [Spirochaetaceae bacterium]
MEKKKQSSVPGTVLALLAFILLWALLAALLKRPFLPGPLKTFTALHSLWERGALVPHLFASLSRVLWALVVSVLPASLLGLAAGRSPRMDSVISPVMYLLHPLPKAAFLPVIMLILGLGEASKIFLLGFIIFSQILVSARDASRQVPSELTASVRSLGAGRMARFRHVILPACLPALFTGLRVSLGTASAVLFLAETFATDTGLGYLITDAWARVAYTELYAAITALSLMGLSLFALADLAERLCCPWKE